MNVELSEKVEAAEEAGELVQAEKGIAAPDIAGIDPAILEMVRSFPEAALIQSFRDLENLILQIRERLPDGRPHRTLPEVLKALERLELIPSSAFALFQSVREARNAAVRGKGEKLTSAEALSLIGQIKLLQGVLAPVLDQLPAKSTVPS